MGAKYIIIACLLCADFVCFAQEKQKRDSIPPYESFVPQTLTTNEYINYQLPPLDSLFEGAKTNPRLKAIGASIEAARNDLNEIGYNTFLYGLGTHMEFSEHTLIKKPNIPL